MADEEDILVGSVVADQAAAEAAEAAKASRARRKSAFPSPTQDGVCSNCGTQLKGLVCHSCGQSADEFHRPVWDLLREIADGLFGVEGRLWRTVPAIIFRPGHVTRRYLSGVRMRYVQPFRLYLAASVLFFLFAFIGGDLRIETGEVVEEGMTQVDREAAAQGMEEAQAALANLDALAPGLSEAAAPGIEEAMRQVEGVPDAVELSPEAQAILDAQRREERIAVARCALVPEDCPEGAEMIGELGDDSEWDFGELMDTPVEFRRYLAAQFETLLRDPEGFFNELLQVRAPQMMFFLLPVFAFLLALTHFWKRGYFFYDHLIVSLHFHAFIFFFLTLLMGASNLGAGLWTIPAFLLWSNFYLYRLHRRVYGHGRISSAFRTIFLDFLYLIVLVFTALLAAVVGLLLL